MNPKRIDKDDKYKVALGALILAASHLEMIILDLISVVTGMHIMSTMIIAGHQQASSKIDSLLALVRLHMGTGDEVENGPIAALTRAKELLDFRNTVVHAFWIEDEAIAGGLKSTRFSARGKLQRSQKAQSPTMLQANADEIVSIAERLEAWRDEWAQQEDTTH